MEDHIQNKAKVTSSNLFGNTDNTFNNICNEHNGGILPPALVHESNVPKFYIEAIKCCGAHKKDQNPITSRVYNLMLTSQLPIEVLNQIWSFVNTKSSNYLTRQEFFSCLALIALVQKKMSISDLSTFKQLPIPFLQTYQGISFNSDREVFKNDYKKEKFLNSKELNENNNGKTSNIMIKYSNNHNMLNNIKTKKDWTTIVDKCVEIIDESNSILTKSLSASTEVSKTRKAKMFIASLNNIHQIVKRLAASITTHNINDKEILKKIQIFSETWANLLELPFFNETIENIPSSINNFPKNTNNKKIYCSICLRMITSFPIIFENGTYHNECSNFWINFVSVILPKYGNES
uniref:EH domain-containing protein n=1 Tax=Strongyloides papillosus TaxID=174720 RepID=A0A0N5BWR8_STREA